MSESMLSILTPKGLRRAVDLSDELLLHMYRTMLTVRALDARAMRAQRQGRIGFYVPCRGSEACHVGSAAALEDSDWIFPSYRETGIPLLRGVDLEALIGQLVGNAADLVRGRQMPNHFSFKDIHFTSISSPIGTQTSQAAGAAMASKYRKDGGVVLTFCGDGSTSSNDFHAGLNFAAVAKAPCIFFVTNNQWAISCPVSEQTASETLAEKAVAYGMPGVRVDGNDIFAVHEATKQAAERARKGEGPTLIEGLTFRMTSHTSSDDASKYVPKELFAEWERKDPVDRVRNYLTSHGLWSDEQEQETIAQAEKEVAAAFKKVLAQPSQPISSIFDDVYATMPPALERQREAFLSELEELGEIENRSEAFPL